MKLRFERCRTAEFFLGRLAWRARFGKRCRILAVVKRTELSQKQIRRPPVAEDVVHVEDEGIAVREFNQTHAKKRRARKVEFKIRLFPDHLLDAVLTLSFPRIRNSRRLQAPSGPRSGTAAMMPTASTPRAAPQPTTRMRAAPSSASTSPATPGPSAARFMPAPSTPTERTA